MSIITTLLDLLMSLLNGIFGSKPAAVPAPAGPAIQARTAQPGRSQRAEPEPGDEEEEEDEDDQQDYLQAALDAQRQQMQGWMDTAVSGENSALLQPIDGVSVETWATIAATLTTLGNDPDGYHRVLAEHDLDAERYEAAQQGWMQRMQSAEDPMAAAAIAQIYGNAFTQSRPAPTAGGEPPCSFERYCEIMGAQSAWAEDGMDVNGQLKAVFGITAADFSDYGAYWNQQLMSDYTLSAKLQEGLEAHKERYRATDDPDADLVL